MSEMCTCPVFTDRWLFRRACRQDLPWLFVVALVHHESWLLVAAMLLLVLSRMVGRADRALGRAQLRRMRDA